MTARGIRRRGLGLAAVLLAAGCGPLGTAVTPGASPEPATSDLPGFATAAPARGAGDLRVSVTDATYGTLGVLTVAGANCTAELSVDGGYYGEQPPTSLPMLSASPAGLVRWTYAAPRVPPGTGRYTVSCHGGGMSGTASARFEIASAPLVARAFSAHVAVEAPPHLLINLDPSLGPLRDAVAATMKATLATEWKNATRGLGGLTLVDQSPDITIYVVASKGTSVHRQYPSDGSEDIVVYVSDRLGPQSVENAVATALHELGHIWCCYGPGTYASGTEQQGHWLTKERSPGLYGVDKYGLMTDPVTCLTFGTIVSCPNRFSDREMTALGFATFPPPVVDACVSQALALSNSLPALKAQLDAQAATLTSLDTQIQAIRAQYPSGSYPPSVAAQYNALVDQYNPLVGPYNQSLATYNTKVQQLNALPCDAS
ncbi:MAG TPA: hypothetical protein VGK15_07000 [Candidatus Limnocylindria bacterium]|jgi:hypothetical protein